MEIEKFTIIIKPRYEISDKEYDQIADDLLSVVCPVILKNLVTILLEGITDHALIIEVE